MTIALLADRIRRGERLLGGLLRLPNAYLTELCGLHRLDFVAFDCEHGPREISVLHQHVLTARAHGLETLVRLPFADSDTVLRALDAGASGIIAPRVSTADQARSAVAAASYPPQGVRGFATYTPAGRYGLQPAAAHLDDAARRLVVVVMIEDQAGVDSAADIVAVPGVSASLVGPADLAVSVGLAGQVTHPRIVEATRSVHEATRAAERAVMVIVGTAAAAAAAYGSGAQIVLYNLALAINTCFTELTAVLPRSDAHG